MEMNPAIDICGTNMIILRQNSEPKIISHPSHDAIIRLNMIFFCCLGHPTVMFKASKASQFTYSLDEELMEDYELWLRLSQTSQIRFANIGQILVCLRKHSDNLSTGVPIEAEMSLKIRLLSQIAAEDKKLAAMIESTP